MSNPAGIISLSWRVFSCYYYYFCDGSDDITLAALFVGSGKTAAFMVPILSQICVRGREIMSQNAVRIMYNVELLIGYFWMRDCHWHRLCHCDKFGIVARVLIWYCSMFRLLWSNFMCNWETKECYCIKKQCVCSGLLICVLALTLVVWVWTGPGICRVVDGMRDTIVSCR